MDDIIKTVYILHLDGTPVLRVDMDLGEDVDNLDGFLGLFGGFSSAINTLVKELGHKEIKSITVSDGVLVYSSRDPLLFVVHSVNPKYEQLSKLLVKQIEHEFLTDFDDVLNDENIFVMCDLFKPFKSNIIQIHENLMKLYSEYPELLDFMSTFIPLSKLYEVLNMGLDLIRGYPTDTIRLVRQLENYFSKDDYLKDVALTLGRYSGHMIAKERYHGEIVIDHDKVLKLLNEISIVKFDTSKECFDFQLCPICREKKSEKPMCEFFSGFIEGALDNPSISVLETTCKARGDRSCSF
ncbi:MAG: V4R domain-containing protein, partial [Candidatus Thorarchaeota archaeon]